MQQEVEELLLLLTFQGSVTRSDILRLKNLWRAHRKYFNRYYTLVTEAFQKGDPLPPIPNREIKATWIDGENPYPYHHYSNFFSW